MTFQQFIARYKFNMETDHIGGGGFGNVYKALDVETDTYVAIKIAPRNPQHPNLTLNKELEVASKLPTNENIAKYRECYTFDQPGVGKIDYAIMTYYVEGSLADLLKRKKLSVDEIDQILTGLLNGLDCLHSNQIIHRDLKPQNILIQEREGNYIPKITDFGISKIVEDFENSKYSNSSIFGTTAYSSPEQLSDKQKIGYNTDIWSLGIIVWQLFLGETPFKSMAIEDNSANAAKLIHNICNEPLPKELVKIPQPYQNLVKQCLLKSNVERLRSVENARQLINTIELKKPEPKPTINIEKKKEEPIIAGTDILEDSNKENKPDLKKLQKEKKEIGLTPKKQKKKNSLYALPLLVLLPLLYLAITQLNKPKFDVINHNFGKVESNEISIQSKKEKLNDNSKFLKKQAIYKQERNGSWGAIDKEGNIRIPFEYKELYGMSDGLVRVRKEEFYGFVDFNGKVIIDLQFDDAKNFIDSKAEVMINQKWYTIDKEGKCIKNCPK